MNYHGSSGRHIPKSRRKRSRLIPRDMTDYLDLRSREYLSDPYVNAGAHSLLHGPSHIVWTSTKPPTVSTSSAYPHPRGGEIVEVHLSSTDAPSGSVTGELYMDGVSVASCHIAASTKVGPLVYPTRWSFDETTQFQWVITGISDLVTQIKGHIQFLPEY